MYTVQWENHFGGWLFFSEHWFLSRARKIACRELAKPDTVKRWRVLDDFGKIIYIYSKEKCLTENK
jgi:hypothetical protein